MKASFLVFFKIMPSLERSFRSIN